jgi:hypothetical protein
MAGRIRPWGTFEIRPAAFAAVLALAAAGVFIAPFVTAVSPGALRCLALAGTLVLWLLFMLVCRVRCERRR